jgi:non-homologous end joining protein Ku
MYDKATGEVVSSQDVERRYEVEGEYVPLSDEEMANVLSNESGTCEIIGFVSSVELGPGGTYHISKVDQLRPARVNKKPVKAVEEAFALLMDAMRRKNLFALVRYVSRTQSKYGALTHDGNFYTLFFDEEVRAPLPLPIVELDEQKRALGDRLVESYVVDAPELNNSDAQSIREYVENKLEAIRNGQEVTVTVRSEPSASTDLLAALEASIK